MKLTIMIHTIILVSSPQDDSPPYLPGPLDGYHRWADPDMRGGLITDLLRNRGEEPRWYGCLAPGGRVVVPLGEEPCPYGAIQRMEQLLGPSPQYRKAEFTESFLRSNPAYATSEPHTGKKINDGQLYGYLDETGKTVLPCAFHTVLEIGRQSLLAKKEGGGDSFYWLYNERGKQVHPGPLCDFVCTGSRIAARKASGQILLYNETNGVVAHTGFTQFACNPGVYPHYLVQGNTGFGLADGEGNLVLPMEYHYVWRSVGEPRGITARRDGRWYFIQV